MLTVDNVVTGYGKIVIVQGITIQVAPKELVTIIGPNGSGKSTLMKAIAGLLHVMRGKIEFEGKDITNRAPFTLAKEGMVFVPQLENVFPNLSIMENLEMGALPNRKERFADNFDRVTRLFPILRERKKTKAKKLSGGERQMLALGRALMAEPRLMLLDEPTAALSPILADEILRNIKRLKEEESISILLVEQNARKSLQISDRAYVLASGKMIIHGKASEVLGDPNIGRAFLGSMAHDPTK